MKLSITALCLLPTLIQCHDHGDHPHHPSSSTDSAQIVSSSLPPLPQTHAPSASPSMNPESWIPIQTIISPVSSPSPNNQPSTTSIPPPSSSAEEKQKQKQQEEDEDEDEDEEPNLELREVVVAPADAPPTIPTQVNPVTTIMQTHWEDGVPTPKAIVYSQAFSAVPDQWPGPRSGSVGMGTIKGEIGVVKTKVAKRGPEAQPTAFAADDPGAAVQKRKVVAAKANKSHAERTSVVSFGTSVIMSGAIGLTLAIVGIPGFV